MLGLLFASISVMVQTGFIIGIGLLIDTFVVRTVTVPAVAAMIGRANWLPGKPARAARGASAPRTPAVPLNAGDELLLGSSSSAVPQPNGNVAVGCQTCQIALSRCP